MSITKVPAGFTLVELLVVLAIIGILVAAGATNLIGTRGAARDAVRMSDLSQIRLGLALYFDDAGQYPAPIKSSGAGPDLSTDTASGTIFSSANNPLFPGYVSKVFQDPMNNNSIGQYYFYDTNQNINHRAYVLCFHQEKKDALWFYFYSTGVYGEGDHCPTMP
ncbi:MAG: type II secretion system protein [Patescibacteria group bacterium]